MSEAVEQEIRTLRAHFWSERDPEGRAFAPLADAYRRKGDLDEAGSLVEDGLARLPEFTPGHLVAARIGRAQGNLEEARAALDRVLELDGQNVLALLERAELARDTGDPEGAMQDLRRLLELDPGHMGARAALDRLEAAGGEPAGREAPTDEAPTEEAPGPSDPATTDEAGFGDLDLEPTALTDPVQEERERRVEEEVDEAFDEAFQPISGDLDVFDFGLDEVEEEGSPEDAQVESAGLEIDPTELDLEATEADLEQTDADLEPTDADLESTGLERGPVEPEPDVEPTDADIESLEPSLPSDEVEIEAGEAEIEAEVVETPREEAETAAGEDEPDEEEAEDSSLMTRTMADLFAKQGLTEQAVGVYERLLERSPDDPEVRQRLSELRARLEEDRVDDGAAGVEAPDAELADVEAPDAESAEAADSTEEPDLRDVAPQWAGDEPGDESEAVATPFAWEPEEGGEAPEEQEAEPETRAAEAPKRSITDHFEDLLAWSPGAVPVEHLAPDAPTETAPPGSLAARGAVPEEPTDVREEPAAVPQEPAAGTEESSAATEESPREDAPAEPQDDEDDDMDDFRSWLKSLES